MIIGGSAPLLRTRSLYVAEATVGAHDRGQPAAWVRCRTRKPGVFLGWCTAKRCRGLWAAISELLPCKTVAALAGLGDLLHTSAGW